MVCVWPFDQIFDNIFIYGQFTFPLQFFPTSLNFIKMYIFIVIYFIQIFG